MRAIATAARLKLRTVPEFHALSMPDARLSADRLLAAAAAMSEAAKKHEHVLIDTGLPEDFIAQLDATAVAMRESLDGRAQNRGRRAGATAGLSDQEKRAVGAITILDSQIRPLVVSDPKLEAQWENAKRIDRKPGRVSGSETTIPTTTQPTSVSPEE